VSKSLKQLVGAGRFELPTPSPPDWCANQAALRSDGTLLLHRSCRLVNASCLARTMAMMSVNANVHAGAGFGRW
jgi:hypothetical protein